MPLAFPWSSCCPTASPGAAFPRGRSSKPGGAESSSEVEPSGRENEPRHFREQNGEARGRKGGKRQEFCPSLTPRALPSLSPPQLWHTTLQTGAEQEEWPHCRPCQTLLSPAPASSQPVQPPRDPATRQGTHLSPPKPLGAQPALRRTLFPVPAAAASFLTPSCPENPKSSFPALVKLPASRAIRGGGVTHEHSPHTCPALVGHTGLPTPGLKESL